MSWSFNQNTPLYLQAAAHIRQAIVRGAYTKGEKLLSVRDMATEASVNPNTMQKAFSLLEDEGLVITEGTSGRYVTSDDRIIARAKEQIALELTKDYMTGMTLLGYSASEAAAMTDSYIKTMSTKGDGTNGNIDN